MFRIYPKKQDHGTRGQKRHDCWSYRYFEDCIKTEVALERKANSRLEKVELNKLKIDCTDEDIEEYEVKSQFIPRATWYWFY